MTSSSLTAMLIMSSCTLDGVYRASLSTLSTVGAWQQDMCPARGTTRLAWHACMCEVYQLTKLKRGYDSSNSTIANGTTNQPQHGSLPCSINRVILEAIRAGGGLGLGPRLKEPSL